MVQHSDIDHSGVTGAGIPASLVTAKGDLIAATGSGAVDNLAAGANDTILMADSGQATGLKWVAAATPTTQDYDDVAAAGTSDTFARGDHLHGMPSASGSASIPSDREVRTAGNFTANSTTWAALTTSHDVTVPAATGDVIEVSMSLYVGNEGVSLGMDARTMVSGSPVNPISGAGGVSDFGVSAWASRRGAIDNLGGSIQYVVQSGDIDGGNVTLRPYYRTHIASNKTIFANTAEPWHFSVKNLGQ